MERLRLRKQDGFTLVELMIVIAIVAIIAAIGVPNYTKNAQKTRRVDAKNELLQIAQSLEKCKSLYGVYNNVNCSGGNLGNTDTVDSDEGFYVVTITIPASGAIFSLSAAPKVGGAQLGDTDCATMTYTNTALKDGGVDTGCWYKAF
jgi:type IV pilus assembly protein PilE|tara:strand:+ start:129 stop:569 length:441 start_codon:yes stop_codon:yes gene_type:complete